MNHSDQSSLEERVEQLEYEVRELRGLFLLGLLAVALYFIFGLGGTAIFVGMAGGIALVIKLFYHSVDRVTKRLNDQTAARKASVRVK